MKSLLVEEQVDRDCRMVSGELLSDSDQYVEVTLTPLDCQRIVKQLVPNADGITWTYGDHSCYAKFGSSETIIDVNGCSYCESCSFGNFDFYRSFHTLILVFTRVM